MSQSLPYAKIKFETCVCLEDLLNNPDDKNIGYFLDVDLTYPYKIRQKTKHFPFAPENKNLSKNDFNEHMEKIKPKNFISQKNYFVIGQIR